MFLAVPAGHRLAGREEVAVAELRDETLALDDPDEGADYNAAVLAVCARCGARADAGLRRSTTDASRTPSSVTDASA